MVNCVKEIYILNNVVNKNFLDFLRNANTSVAFREYLTNGIIKTAKMEKVDKFPIV